jgi:hypothetical protein
MEDVAAIRDAPARAVTADTSRTRSGNLSEGPASPISNARQEGVSDYQRRWAFVAREGIPLGEQPGSSRVASLVRSRMDALVAPRELLFIDGVVCTLMPDGCVFSTGRRRPQSPRLYNDPAWTLDLLYGVSGPVERAGTDERDGVVLTHFVCSSDVRAADRHSPHGVELHKPEVMALHVWLDEEGLARRISREQVHTFPDRQRFWSASEFWDFGVDAVAAASPFVATEIASKG